MGLTGSFTRLALLGAVGISMRFLLIYSSYQKEISERVEVSTPVTAWKRVVEGVHLQDIGVSPYEGDTFHESPISLFFFSFILKNLNDWIAVIFVTADVLTAIILSIASYVQVAHLVAWEKPRVKKLPGDDSAQIAINESQITNVVTQVGAIYLLSPYSILACVGHSTAVFSNLLTALLLLSVSLRHRILSCALAAVVAFQNFYPLVLIIPVALIIEHHRSKSSRPSAQVDYSSKNVWTSLIATVVIFFVAVFALLGLAYHFNGNRWNFLGETYGFLINVGDLTPNVGLFWYFFTEMFDHFRTFFLWTFQVNSFIFAIPLGISLRHNPYELFYVLLILLSLLKPYPSISDLSIYLALLPQWYHLSNFMKQGLVIGAMLVSCSVLAPITWHMWILMGTGNSNFYFGVTLAYNTAQIFLVTDLLFAITKREFYLNNGIVIDKEGNPAKLELVHE